MRFAIHFAKQKGSFPIFFSVFQRAVEGKEGNRGDRGLLRRRRAIEKTEVLRGDRES
jgi:hypothetical protein